MPLSIFSHPLYRLYLPFLFENGKKNFFLLVGPPLGKNRSLAPDIMTLG